MATAKYPDVFEAVFAATTRAAKAGSIIKTLPLQLPTSLLRTTDAKWYTDLLDPSNPRLTPQVERDARTPRDGKENKNRWSGIGLGQYSGKSVAGLYLSKGTYAVSAETTHYSGAGAPRGSDGFPDLTALFVSGAADRKLLFSLRVLEYLKLVDLSKEGLGKALFDFLDADRAVRASLTKRFGPGASTRSKAFAPDDYSVARGIALALAGLTGPDYDGIVVRTARIHLASRSDGDNMVLFGRDLQPHPALRVEYVQVFTPNGADRMSISRLYPS